MTGLNDTDIRLNSEWQLTQATDGGAAPRPVLPAARAAAAMR